MGKRKLKPAIEIISAIGCLGFDLQHHSEAAIAEAMTFMRRANPEIFAWISQVLREPQAVSAVDPVRDDVADPSTRV